MMAAWQEKKRLAVSGYTTHGQSGINQKPFRKCLFYASGNILFSYFSSPACSEIFMTLISFYDGLIYKYFSVLGKTSAEDGW